MSSAAEPAATRTRSDEHSSGIVIQAPARKRQLFSLISAQLDAVVALGLVALLGFYFGLQRQPVQVNALEDFDLSFTLDMITKLRQHVWLGRDVAFTYGPLCQWIFGHLALARGDSLGGIFLSLMMFQFWSIIVLLYLAGALLLGHQAAWRRAFCLLLLVVFWVPILDFPYGYGAVKTLLTLVGFAALLKLSKISIGTLRAIVARAALAAALVATCSLFSADAGAYAAAGLVVVLIARILASKEREQRIALLRFAMWTGALGGVFVLAINALFGRIFDFRFWRSVAEVIAQYRWTENYAMSPLVTRRFFLALVIGVLIFIAAWIQQRRRPAREWDAAVFWALAIFSLPSLESAIVCSERLHVALALLPMIALTCYVIFGAADGARSQGSGIWPVGAALLLTAVLSGPNHVFVPRNLAEGFRTAGKAIPCEAGTKDLAGICIAQADYGSITSISGHLAKVSSPADAVEIFPYQNMYGYLSGRRVAGAVLQNYVEAGDWLTEQQINSYQREQPASALFFADDVASVPLNQVPNFTREPQIWLYLQRWYRAVDVPAPGVALLQRDSQRAASWRMTSEPIAPMAQHYEIQDNVPIALANVSAPDFDFLRITLRLDYPAWWRLLKPAMIFFDLDFTDGSHRRLAAAVQPERPYEVWIYPWQEAGLARYLAPDEQSWRNPQERSRVTQLSVAFSRWDKFSVLPSNLEIDRIDGVSVHLR